MTYDPNRMGIPGGGFNAGPANNWYTLQNADIGAAELPKYGRALLITVGPAVALPLAIVVVPLAEPDDAQTRTITIYDSGDQVIPRAVRRIVSIAGGATVPAGVQIDVVTA